MTVFATLCCYFFLTLFTHSNHFLISFFLLDLCRWQFRWYNQVVKNSFSFCEEYYCFHSGLALCGSILSLIYHINSGDKYCEHLDGVHKKSFFIIIKIISRRLFLKYSVLFYFAPSYKNI